MCTVLSSSLFISLSNSSSLDDCCSLCCCCDCARSCPVCLVSFCCCSFSWMWRKRRRCSGVPCKMMSISSSELDENGNLILVIVLLVVVIVLHLFSTHFVIYSVMNDLTVMLGSQMGGERELVNLQYLISNILLAQSGNGNCNDCEGCPKCTVCFNYDFYESGLQI